MENEDDDGSFLSAVYDYKDKFGDTPIIVSIFTSTYAEAANALRAAIDADEPFKSDAEFFRAIGIAPPPEDVIL